MDDLRLHVVGLPHTELTRDYEWCAFTSNARKFVGMMRSLGHEVFTYEGRISDTHNPSYRADDPIFQAFNAKVVMELHEKSQPGDYLCLVGGTAQQPIAQAFPDLITVEYAVGYEGTFARFRVFPSYAWMHAMLGPKADGQFMDLAVIPHFYEPEDFPKGEGGDYLLHVGRLIPRKGLHIAGEIAQRTGLQLVVAGEGDTSLIPKGAEYVGLVGPAQRAKLMGGARALVCPTVYLEPFGAVAVEAQMTGTPVLASPFGGFTETVEHGGTGFLCHTLAEFCQSAIDVGYLDRPWIRQRAIDFYSVDNVRHQYQDYFERLETLKSDGWYA